MNPERTRAVQADMQPTLQHVLSVVPDAVGDALCTLDGVLPWESFAMLAMTSRASREAVLGWNVSRVASARLFDLIENEFWYPVDTDLGWHRYAVMRGLEVHGKDWLARPECFRFVEFCLTCSFVPDDAKRVNVFQIMALCGATIAPQRAGCAGCGIGRATPRR